MTKREKLDPSWHKARVAALIWLKMKRGKPLSARDKRLAHLLGNDKGVTDRLIEQARVYWTAPFRRDGNGKRVLRACHVLDPGN